MHRVRGPVRRALVLGLKTVGGLLLLALAWVAIYRVLDPPFTFLTLRDRLAGRHVEWTWVPLARIAPNLPRAVIAAEDARFCAHHGFDLEAIRAAAARNAAGGHLRGGSTISQQTAKNVFLWPGRSWLRKGLEAGFTAGIEALWGKRRIMEVYLNVVEQGRGVYGAEAGAQHAFNHSALHLSVAEAGRLAAILPLPTKRSAAAPSRSTRRYAGRIDKRSAVVRADALDACIR